MSRAQHAAPGGHAIHRYTEAIDAAVSSTLFVCAAPVSLAVQAEKQSAADETLSTSESVTSQSRKYRDRVVSGGVHSLYSA